MKTEETFQCLICEKHSPTSLNDTYRGGRCIHCGQSYEYEEGWQVVLTEKQLTALRLFLPNAKSEPPVCGEKL